MSRLPSENDQGTPQEPGALVQAMPIEEPRRAASLTLRTDQVREERLASMEAANKSLGDALRITYRLLQVVMLALIVLFLFSGFQQVNQSESGIRVELGKIKTEQLDPGFQFSLPYPLGEIVKIETGNRTLEVDDSFWPAMRPEDRRKPITEAGTMADRLDPARDGSLLTADSNIAHAQWSVVYARSRPASFVKNIYTDAEQPIVKAAVERAAVHVAASVSIDDLLKPGAASSGGNQENSVESRVRAEAQAMLDELDSGIDVTQVILRSASPPKIVFKDFSQVQTAQSNAGKVRDQAMGDRSKRLNEVAGAASPALLDLIDRYEAALELKDAAQIDQNLALIDKVLLGEVTPGEEIAGKTYTDAKASGQVASMIAEAQQYRTTVVQQAQRQAETFSAKLQQYRANPRVFLSGELVDAMQAFTAPLKNDIIWIPESTQPFELRISRDPELARQVERDRYTQDVEGQERVKEMREALKNQQ